MAPLPPGLPDFPAAERRVETPESLRARGLWLRRATSADLPWLCGLYGTTRAEELAAVPWPDALKQAFLADQFALQHRHYTGHYDRCDFLIVESEQGPLGRFYLQRGERDSLLVDICLLPESRGRGIGGLLIEAAQGEAGASGCGMVLHVLRSNLGAIRLYERLGFVVVASEGMHHRMRWSCGGVAAVSLSGRRGGSGGAA